MTDFLWVSVHTYISLGSVYWVENPVLICNLLLRLFICCLLTGYITGRSKCIGLDSVNDAVLLLTHSLLYGLAREHQLLFFPLSFDHLTNGVLRIRLGLKSLIHKALLERRNNSNVFHQSYISFSRKTFPSFLDS